MQELFKAKWFQYSLAVLGLLIIVIWSFTVGVGVGERKARHFSNWAQNYDRMFDPRHDDRKPQQPPPGPMGNLPDAHGAFGKILSVSGSSIVIQGKDNLEQNILVTSSTEIRYGRERGTLQDLKPDTDAAVFGAPNNQGQIEARLIRLMGPLPPQTQPPTAATSTF